jgi:hypothetical protein
MNAALLADAMRYPYWDADWKANNVRYSAYTLFEQNQSYQLIYQTDSAFQSTTL